MPRLVKGDTVLVVTGNDAGKTGKVLKVFPDKNRVVVEGVNFIKRHTRPTQRSPQGGIQEREAAINASNAMLYCSKCGRGTRVRHQELSDGTKVRACSHCGEVIEKPRG
jgi:large subunit ribosomal protein L24